MGRSLSLGSALQRLPEEDPLPIRASSGGRLPSRDGPFLTCECGARMAGAVPGGDAGGEAAAPSHI